MELAVGFKNQRKFEPASCFLNRGKCRRRECDVGNRGAGRFNERVIEFLTLNADDYDDAAGAIVWPDRMVNIEGGEFSRREGRIYPNFFSFFTTPLYTLAGRVVLRHCPRVNAFRCYGPAKWDFTLFIGFGYRYLISFLFFLYFDFMICAMERVWHDSFIHCSCLNLFFHHFTLVYSKNYDGYGMI